MQVALVARYSILLNFHFHPLKCQPPSSVITGLQYFEVWTSANYKDTNISYIIGMLEQTE